MVRRTAAYHEAGHAVVGVLLRWAIREVSIIPDGESDGRVRHPRRSEVDYWLAEEVARLQASSKRNGHKGPLSTNCLGSSTRAQARMRQRRARIDIAVRLAGPIAEMKFAGECCTRSGHSDRFQLLELADLLAAELSITAQSIVRLEEARARRLLRQNWNSVHAVAAQLLSKSRMSGRAVRAIVKSTAGSTIHSRHSQRLAQQLCAPQGFLSASQSVTVDHGQAGDSQIA
jgi:hypothetical protein